MANLTRAEMIDRVLERLGIKAAGQSATAEDSDIAGEAIDAAHERLRKYGLVPFATSAFPPWAQTPFCEYVKEDLAEHFGIQKDPGKQRAAEFELERQTSGYRHPVRIVTSYF